MCLVRNARDSRKTTLVCTAVCLLTLVLMSCRKHETPTLNEAHQVVDTSNVPLADPVLEVRGIAHDTSTINGVWLALWDDGELLYRSDPGSGATPARFAVCTLPKRQSEAIIESIIDSGFVAREGVVFGESFEPLCHITIRYQGRVTVRTWHGAPPLPGAALVEECPNDPTFEAVWRKFHNTVGALGRLEGTDSREVSPNGQWRGLSYPLYVHGRPRPRQATAGN